MPVIPFPSTMTDDAVQLTSAGAAIRYVRINQAADGFFALNMNLANANTAERVFVSYTGSAGAACRLGFNSTIKDSVCWSSGTDDVGMNLSFSGNYTSTGGVLRNVTAVATGGGDADVVAGLRLRAANGADLAVDAKNVIARRTATGVDVRTTEQCPEHQRDDQLPELGL